MLFCFVWIYYFVRPSKGQNHFSFRNEIFGESSRQSFHRTTLPFFEGRPSYCYRTSLSFFEGGGGRSEKRSSDEYLDLQREGRLTAPSQSTCTKVGPSILFDLVHTTTVPVQYFCFTVPTSPLQTYLNVPFYCIFHIMVVLDLFAGCVRTHVCMMSLL